LNQEEQEGWWLTAEQFDPVDCGHVVHPWNGESIGILWEEKGDIEFFYREDLSRIEHLQVDEPTKLLRALKTIMKLGGEHTSVRIHFFDLRPPRGKVAELKSDAVSSHVRTRDGRKVYQDIGRAAVRFVCEVLQERKRE